MKHNNDDGSAGGITTIVFIFLLAGVLFITNGYAIDKFTQIANTGMFATLAASQLRYDVFNLMVMVFRFQPFLILISLGINRLMSANMQFSEQTPLSSLTFGIVELEFATVFIMAITMYGGYALDGVISTITALKLGGIDTSGYEIIQYIPNVFYGLLFLILIGMCVQFVLECVQVSDHTVSFTQSN